MLSLPSYGIIRYLGKLARKLFENAYVVTFAGTCSAVSFICEVAMFDKLSTYIPALPFPYGRVGR